MKRHGSDMNESEFSRLTQSTRHDEERLISIANKIYGVTTLLVPVMVMLGVVVTANLIDTGASALMIICAALFSLVISVAMYSMAVMSKLVAKLLTHIADVVLAQQEINANTAHTPTDIDSRGPTNVVIERLSMEINTNHDAICPSCELEINRSDTHCPRCRAVFLEGSPWAPIPK